MYNLNSRHATYYHNALTKRELLQIINRLEHENKVLQILYKRQKEKLESVLAASPPTCTLS